MTTAAPPTVTLALDELTLRVSAPTGAALRQLTRFWCDSCFLTTQPPLSTPVTMQIDFLRPGTSAPPVVDRTPIYTTPDLTVWPCVGGFRLCCGESWLQLDLTQGSGWGVLLPDFWQTRAHDQRDFLLLPLLMVGHRHGYYGLHANGLYDGRRAYLLVGPSGSGKSTLAVRLMEQGWAHAGDDVVLLHADEQKAAGVKVFALRRDFALSAKTVAHCAALTAGTKAVAAATAQAEKAIFGAAHFGPSLCCLSLVPARLLFTTIVDQAASRLAPLAQTEALVQLAQQSAGLLSDRTVAQAQMQLLAKLCRQAQAYQLWLGRDVLTAPTQVAALLQALP